MTGAPDVAPRTKFTTLRRSPVYDLYWKFATERQAVFFRRLEGGTPPWSRDPIMRNYRFTNAYRASDRVSQYLIRNVIYNSRYPNAPAEIVFRTLLFKFFNKISTWELLEREIGLLTWQSFDLDAYGNVLSQASLEGRRIYSAAYIMPPVAIEPSSVKHRGHLRLIDLILRSDFVRQLQSTRGLQEVFFLLRAFPSLGDFLAFQFAIDLNYTPVIDHDESSFVVAGPGARDGLRKIFPEAEPSMAAGIIEFMMEQQHREFERLELDFRSIWGRPLQLIDCQNLFCEISKYTRVSNPEIVGLSGRTRIKQVFRPGSTLIQPWYPPKWNLNGSIANYTAATRSDLFNGAK